LHFCKIFPISFSMMLKTARRTANKLNGQLSDIHIEKDTYRRNNNIKWPSVVRAKILTKKKRLRYTLRALSFLRFSLFISLFFFSFFLLFIIVSYHQAPYFQDWFQIASGLTKLSRSFSASLTAINKSYSLEFKDIYWFNIFQLSIVYFILII
jgi:hypothetical protein